MYRYVTLNGDVYVKVDPTFWTKERKLWGMTLIAIATTLLNKWRKHERS